MEGILPKQTIYVKNIYERLGVTELKKCLYCLFTQFGQIAHVQCCKTSKLRGQAWVIFADVPSATNALQCMNGFPFFDKPLEIQYAKDESVALKKSVDGWKSRKKQKTEQKKSAPKDSSTATTNKAGPAKPHGESNPPNKLLLVEGLPQSATSQMLELVCNQFPGLVEVRMVAARPGLAFVEYDSEPSATQMMNGLQNFTISEGHNLVISYAK